MNHQKHNHLAWILMALLIALSVSGGAPRATAAAPSTASCGGWNIVTSPNPFAYYNFLSAVTAVSATDVWAVGYGQNAYAGSDATLVEQWTGQKWRVVASPSPDGGSLLAAVTALSATNIWAVGERTSGTLIEQWTGTSWQVIPSPGPGQLYAVAASAASDIWAVGSFFNAQANHTQTLIEHWDGSTWSIVPSPNVHGADNNLQGVAAISPQDAWAVGYYSSNQTGGGLIEHWDGKRWSFVTQPHKKQNAAYSIFALSANDIWAVGGNTNGALTEHWNGSRWRIVPDPGTLYDSLDAVAASATNNVWTVGFYRNINTDLLQTFTQRWNGKGWQVVGSPNVPSDDNGLSGVSAVSAHDVWAVGTYSPHNQGPNPIYTLIEHDC